MTNSREQSGHTRRVMQRLESFAVPANAVTANNLSAFAEDVNTDINTMRGDILTLQQGTYSLRVFDAFHTNPENPVGWESRIVALEAASGGGYDPSDPTQPVIVWDNFLSAVDGYTGDYPVPFQNDSDGLRLISSTFIRDGNITLYEGPSEVNHVGVYRVMGANQGGGNNVGVLSLAQPTTASVLWESLDTIYFVIKSPNDAAAPGFSPYTTSTNYDIYLGLFSDGLAPPTNGVYFKRLNGGNWILENNDAGITNGVTVNPYAMDTWYTLKIRRASTTTVGYTINGGTEEIVTGNIPLTGMTCGIIIKNNTGDTVSRVRSLRLDFFSIKFI